MDTSVSRWTVGSRLDRQSAASPDAVSWPCHSIRTLETDEAPYIPDTAPRKRVALKTGHVWQVRLERQGCANGWSFWPGRLFDSQPHHYVSSRLIPRRVKWARSSRDPQCRR